MMLLIAAYSFGLLTGCWSVGLLWRRAENRRAARECIEWVCAHGGDEWLVGDNRGEDWL